MSDLWFTVGVPATVGVATALYTTGGHGALARRAIKQDLEIAAMLPPGRGREAVERMAEEKAVLYSARWIGPQTLSLRSHLHMGAVAVAGGLLTWGAASLADQAAGRIWITSALLLTMLVGMAALVVAVVSWLSLVFMADNAKTRRDTVKVRRSRVDRYRSQPGTP
jgi:hypothetical protein